MSSVLHTITNSSTTVESYCKRKTAGANEDLKISFFGTYCLEFICYDNFVIVLYFSFLMLILRHCLEYNSTVFVYLACFLNAQGILKERHLSLMKRSMSSGTSGRDDEETTCFRRPVSRRLISADILHTA